MNLWQGSVLIIIALYSILSFILGLRQVYFRKNPYGLTPQFYLLGGFVWTDTIVFGLFFLLVSLVSLITHNFILFCLIYSVFWVVRSLGEQIYWFIEQFTHKHRNKPETLLGHKFFPEDSIWITYQIFWQCVSVVSIIASVYFFAKWLQFAI